MADVAARLDEAISLHQAGDVETAAVLYRGLLAADADHHPSLHLLGLLAHQRGDARAAIGLVSRAIGRAPNAAHYRNTLAAALRAGGQVAEAAAEWRVARSLRPDSAEIATNLGAVLTELGQWPEAIDVLREAVALDPGLADAHYNLANALSRSGVPETALPVYAHCVLLRPDFVDAHFNLGHALATLGRADEALACYRRVLQLNPAHVDALNNLGVLLQEFDHPDAEASLAEALRLRPADPAIRCNLAAVLLGQGRTEAAAARFEEVLAVLPDHGAARLGRLVAHLPVVPRDDRDVASGRAAYAAGLAALRRDAVRRPALRQALAAAAGTAQPFFLAYQGEDDRALQRHYGRLMHRLAGPPAAVPTEGQPIRLGIVSGFFCEHTIWTLFLQGWLTQLDAARFRLFGYHTGARHDACTAEAARRCERFVSGRRTVAAWREAVLRDAPHVLLYPEVGMDPVAAGLAAQRLAPVQCAAWGHPVTTGLPSIDHFLSSRLMEPAGAGRHYTERLVRLPNLGVFCEPPGDPGPPATSRTAGRGEFGLRGDGVLYWSGQNLAKYQPRHDEVFPRIAEALPRAQFVFIAFGRGTEMTSRFVDRLHRVFARFGLDAAAHCVMLPQLSQSRFLAAAGLCDVVLDTIGWSGGKSTLDLLTTHPAIVTLPGPFLRGRHTAAILQRMGATDTIARTVDEYVAIAVRLGGDPGLRASVRARVEARKPLVYRDASVIDALEVFLRDAVVSARRRGPGGREA